MRLPLQEKYGIQALVALGLRWGREKMPTREIAEKEGIPRKFLEQVLLTLKEAGIVESARGKDGGYVLRRQPQEVSLRQVVEAFEGPLALLPCLKGKDAPPCTECRGKKDCWMRDIVGRVNDLVVEAFERVSLADVCQQAEKVRRSTPEGHMYHI
jgi:Rrf2 family protein